MIRDRELRAWRASCQCRLCEYRHIDMDPRECVHYAQLRLRWHRSEADRIEHALEELLTVRESA